MITFRNSPRAVADLEAITDYFEEHNPDYGVRPLDEITARCRQLANQPRQGRPRDNLGTGIRSVAVRDYVVFFRPSADGIDVVRVIHGARDITPDMFDD